MNNLASPSLSFSLTLSLFSPSRASRLLSHPRPRPATKHILFLPSGFSLLLLLLLLL